MNARTLTRIALLTTFAVSGSVAAQRSADTPSASSYAALPSLDASRTGWVHVDITALKPRMASELGVDAGRIPNIVEVPLSVAAGTCGEDRGDVAGASGEPVTACRARSFSADVRDAVRDEMARASPNGR